MPRIRKLLRLSAKQYYREFWALQDVSFDIKRGETVGIIGRNGSGKSTLLQMICGTLSPTSGEIETVGRVAALLELGSGFNPEFTGRENIYMNATVLGLSEQEIDERYDEIVRFADIGDFISQPVKTYSSGMYVRLAFAVAINVSPDILIVDEALAVGDASFQAKCMKKFEEFRRAGTTIILVTHDLGAILQFSSRCILLDRSRQIETSTPKESVDTFKKLLLGASKSKNTIRSDSDDLPYLKHLQENGAWARNYSINHEGAEVYGSEKAYIKDIGIFDQEERLAGQKLSLGETYTFKMLIGFNEALENPIFTLTFRDLTGREIAGTNTKNKRILTGSFNPSEEVEVSFLVDLRLAPGTYLLTYACSGFERDDFVVYQRLYHVLIIEIYSTEDVVGIFDMQAEIQIKKLNS